MEKSLVNRFMSLSHDAFSAEIIDKDSIFYTLKKDDYSFYIQHYSEKEDNGFDAIVTIFKGDNRIGGVTGDIETIFDTIISTLLNKNE
jgi:hypothetical protein